MLRTCQRLFAAGLGTLLGLTLSTMTLAWTPPASNRGLAPQGSGPPATASGPASDAAPRVAYADDFDWTEPLSERWSLYGRVAASRVGVDPGAADAARRALRIEAEPGGGLRGQALPEDVRFDKCETLVLRARAATASRRKPVVFHVRLYSGESPMWRWEPVRLRSAEWREVRIPLRRARPARNAVIPWSGVRSIGFHFPRAGQVSIDAIELLDSRPGGPDLSIDEIRALAFGQQQDVHTFEQTPFVILSDAEVDEAELRKALRNLIGWVRDDFPQRTAAISRQPSAISRPGVQPGAPNSRPSTPSDGGTPSVCVLLFASEDDCRQFWPRLGHEFGVKLMPPVTPGFTFAGIAGAVCPASPCSVRPVMVHEAAHALLEPVLRLSGSGDWLHEGLATRYQMRFTGQDLAPLVREGISSPTKRLPFDALLSGGRIAPTYAWQAASVIEWLLTERRESLFRALDDMAARGSSAMHLLADEHFGMNLHELERRWLAWAAGP